MNDPAAFKKAVSGGTLVPPLSKEFVIGHLSFVICHWEMVATLRARGSPSSILQP